jgi:hypothetical protein
MTRRTGSADLPLHGGRVPFIEDVDAIEEKYFIALGNVLAGRAAAEFGLQNDAAIAARAEKGETDLNEMDQNSVRYRHERTMRTDYPRTRCW